VSALSLFELYFDEAAIKRVIDCTLEYAEDRRSSKQKRYNLFMKKSITEAEIKAFLGALLLLGIHGVQNHRRA